MSTKKQKISQIISEEGFYSFFKRVLRYLRKNIIGITKVYIFELDLEKPYPKITSELNLSFRLATMKDIESLDEENFDYDKKAKQYAKERLKKGDKCALMIYSNRIIGYVWTMEDFLDTSTFNFVPISKNRVSTYKTLVLKELRGKRVRNACDTYIFDMFKKSGKRFTVCVIDKDNKSSIKTRQRVGYKKIGHVYQFRFFGLKYDHVKKSTLSYIKNP